MLTTGAGFTVTVTLAESLHPNAEVPTTLYVIVAAGDAVGFAHVVQLRPAEGLHKKVDAPVALSVTLSPGQIDRFAPALTIGNGLTVTTTVSRFEQPLASAPVTMYEVVVVGVTVGLAQLVQDRPEAGLHE